MFRGFCIVNEDSNLLVGVDVTHLNASEPLYQGQTRRDLHQVQKTQDLKPRGQDSLYLQH